MSRGQNTIKRSEISTTPILLKYSTSYPSASFTSKGITVNRGVNSTYASSGVTSLNYALVKQLYYQEYITGSVLFSSSFWNSSPQSTAASGTLDLDYRYFPTESNSQITVVAIPRTVFGEQIARRSLLINSDTYTLIDDGNGNLIDTFVTGSQSSKNNSYGRDGVKLYSAGYNIDGTGTSIVWNTANSGGTYAGTFWANPVVANQTGRLNYTGLWSAKSLIFFGSGNLTFTFSAPSTKTYYFGIGCDNYASLYVDNVLILSQPVPDPGVGDNYSYWHIYPIDLTSGNHTIKIVGTNSGIPSVLNPASLGIEIYDNTSTQISASINAEPLGASTPAGINLSYSSKDYLTSGVFGEYTNVGNVLYSQGVIVITNPDYVNAMIP